MTDIEVAKEREVFLEEFKRLGVAPIYHGDFLRKSIDTALEERPCYISGLLYHNSVIQVFADDGLGKSMVLLNLACEASSGSKVFKTLNCEKPINVIWHCCERPLDEPFERIKLMEGAININIKNMIFDKEIQAMDLTSADGFADFMIRMVELVSCFDNSKVDLVIIDPIYAITGGDLSNPKDCHCINHLLRTLQYRFGCAIMYTHHTNRGTMFEGKRTDGDMYGNRFLKANVTGQFHLKKTEDGVELVNTKNTYGNLLKNIPLVFDEITQTLTMSHDSDDYGKRDKILLFLRKKHTEKKEFTLRELSNCLKVSDAYIRKTIAPMLKTGHIINKSAHGTKAVYFLEKNV